VNGKDLAASESAAVSKLGEPAVEAAYQKAGVDVTRPWHVKTLQGKRRVLDALGFPAAGAVSLPKPSPGPAPSAAQQPARPSPKPAAAPSKPTKPDIISFYGLACRCFSEAGINAMLANEPHTPEARFARLEKRFVQEHLVLPYEGVKPVGAGVMLPRPYGAMASSAHAARQQLVDYFFAHNHELP
jgi:hypothetical protein